MSWKFGEKARAGAETALDACDYFVDDVKDVWSKTGLYLTSAGAFSVRKSVYQCVHKNSV